MGKVGLVTILADHLHGRASVAEVTPELVREANRHEVGAIVYRQTRAPELEKTFFYALAADRKRRRLDREIREALLPKGIALFSVKGLFVADFYPAPALRTMGDIDYVASDRPAARKILEGLGYKFHESEGVADWHFRKGEWEFELHDRLLYDERYGTKVQVRTLNDCFSHYQDGAIDNDFHFLFLMAHLRKHLLEGVGFRQFFDIAVLLKNGRAAFDWGKVRRDLKKIGLLSFTETVFGLCQAWFKVEPPFAIPRLPKGFAKSAAAEIYRSGVFGAGNHLGGEGWTVRMPGSTRLGYRATRGLRLLQRAFPPYDEMVLYPQYAFLKKRKYLLPVAWVCRFGRDLFRKDKWRKFRGDAALKKERFEERNKTLRRWGL